MSRPRNTIPSYRLHKQSGQAIVTLTDGLGRRRDVLLGKHGSPESRAAYARAIAEWEATGRGLTDAPAPAGASVNEVMLAFLRFAERHYRRADGTVTNEFRDYKLSFRLLKELYGATPARDFGPLALKAVRQKMVEAGWCRRTINQRTWRVKRLFKWAASEELVPPHVHHALATVAGLARGRSDAAESEPVGPVPDAHVDAVLPLVLPPVAAMIELQRLSGMRPGEVVAVRAADLDTRGPVWFYRVARNKVAWKGRERRIALGAKAQVILKRFMTLDTQAFLFSPARAMTERAAALRANRKTKLQPSQRDRRRRKPKRTPHDWYTVRAYELAITRGCDRADRHDRQAAENKSAESEGRPPVKVPAEVPDAERVVPRWAPNRLRHNFATEVRRRHGLEAAGAALGHSKMSATEVYAERDLSLAERIAREIG